MSVDLDNPLTGFNDIAVHACAVPNLLSNPGDYKISNLTENVMITLPKIASNFYGNGPYCVFYQFPVSIRNCVFEHSVVTVILGFILF